MKASRKIGTLFVVCALALGATMAVTLSAGRARGQGDAPRRELSGLTVAAAALQIPPRGLL